MGEELNLPTEPDALWPLLADVLQALQEAGEDPVPESGRGRSYHYDAVPMGIRRTATDGGGWPLKVEWTNASGAWRWTHLEGE